MSDDMVYRRYAAKHPELDTAPVSTEPYVSENFFEQERSAIFERCWLNVGRVEELPKPGDFLVKNLDVCHTSALVVHGKDGVIRAFHNVCKHRGNILEWHSSGRCNGYFTCKFHGWVYDEQGALRDITDEKNFHDVDKDALGLTAIATDIWRGFIFVCLQPEQTLREYLGGVDARLSPYPFERFATRFDYRADERVNWKILLDAQQEGYHVPFLHKRTIAHSFKSDLGETAFRTKNFETFGPHRVLAHGAADSFEATPVGGLAASFGATSSDAFAGRAAETGESAALDGVFDFWVIFPNMVLGLMYGTYFSYNIWPRAVDRSIWEVHLYYPEPNNAAQAFSNEYGKCAFRDALLEDGSTHECMQRGIGSGVIDAVQFQDEEIMARHSNTVVRDMVQRYAQRAGS